MSDHTPLYPVPTKIGRQTITPAKAADWLERTDCNRPLRKAYVAELARAMSTGQWLFAGGTVGFDTNEALIDGQHRLAAIVESHKSQDFVVIPNLPVRDAQRVMDQGLRRTAGDALALGGGFDGVPVQTLAAVARIGFQMDTGTLFSKGRPTNTEVVTWAEAHRDIAEYARRGHNKARMFGVRGAVLGYCMWRLSKVDLDAAEMFFYDWEFSQTKGEGDALAALISRLRMVEREKQHVSQADLIGAIFRVWNARRAGQPLGRILFRNNTGQPVAIPEPK